MKKKIQKYEVQAGNMWGGKKREKKKRKWKVKKLAVLWGWELRGDWHFHLKLYN